MAARRSAIRKADLAPAFEAAKLAGYDHVTIAVETADGSRFLITAGSGGGSADSSMSPLDRWKANRVAC